MKPLRAEDDPEVLGPFQLLARLGAGGMGIAYAARRMPLRGMSEELAATYHLVESDDAHPDGPGEPGGGAVERLVVVKRIQPSLLGESHARERFGREIDAVQAVVGPRVPEVLAADPGAAVPWFAMEYIAGPSLHTLVKETGPLAPGPSGALGLALVEALRAIHGAGLLHRDLKPGNVVLGPEGPVVLDFGLAVLSERRTDQAITRSGTSLGTYPYMPLEQMRDARSVKEPADVYGLGATLFFALTGRPPYEMMPLASEPVWDGVDLPFLPLLAKILVPRPEARPDLDAVEESLLVLLADAGLSPESAAERLAGVVAAADLAPALPPGLPVDRPDPAVRAQRALDAGALPDAPWAAGAGTDPIDDPGFHGLVDFDETGDSGGPADTGGGPAILPPTSPDPFP
ncbi:serine/threonine-protein kinase, partial [Streptomyces alkaliphilus]|uniref:serine/threonine-protein kinase n=1 Tax=Streptomyces alkaliphilus TaxID=1472722 RepID=UPI00117DC16D